MEEALTHRSLHLRAAVIFASLAATPAFAANTFQNTCSEIHFAYQGNNPTVQAVCLKVDGSPSPTSLVLQGISNQNGQLTQGTGPSTFQKSCGNILVSVGNGSAVTLSAICRHTNGSSEPTSLPLNNIGNNNGNLFQQ
jgi:hypothetical protein